MILSAPLISTLYIPLSAHLDLSTHLTILSIPPFVSLLSIYFSTTPSLYIMDGMKESLETFCIILVARIFPAAFISCLNLCIPLYIPLYTHFILPHPPLLFPQNYVTLDSQDLLPPLSYIEYICLLTLLPPSHI